MSSEYKSPKLKEFILSLSPNIIYAPGRGVYYMNWLIQWIATFTSCPIISLISDDYYTYGIRSYNPLYWINQPFLRHYVRKSAKLYNLVYTMTDIQKSELEKDLKVKSKVLVKNTSFDSLFTEKPIGSPIRLIYAGNLYVNRWKALLYLVKAIKEFNRQANSSVFYLNIYTGSTIDAKK